MHQHMITEKLVDTNSTFPVHNKLLVPVLKLLVNRPFEPIPGVYQLKDDSSPCTLMYATDGGSRVRRRRRIYQQASAAHVARKTKAAIVPPAIAAVLFPVVVDEDWSKPKVAVANEVELDLITVEVSVVVVWKVLIVVGSVCAVAVMNRVGCGAIVMELAAEGEKVEVDYVEQWISIKQIQHQESYKFLIASYVSYIRPVRPCKT